MRKLLLLLFAIRLAAQQPQPSQPAAPGGLTTEQLAKANNPLADLNALNFSEYYVPTLYGVPNVTANTMNLRGVMVSGRQIVRLTVPLQTSPAGRSSVDIPGFGSLPDVALPIGPVQYRSGLGDVSIFDSIRLTSGTGATDFAIGPQLTAPTATNSSLGSGKWQLGAAGIVVHHLPGGSLLGALIIYQHDVAGDKDRPGTNVGAFQPFLTLGIGGGYYVKSTAIWTFDIRNDRYLIPFGIGAGKVIKLGDMLVNASIEPQFSVYHKGAGLPSFQLFAGLAFQWVKKPK